MSGISNKVEQVEAKFLHSGEPGSSGREVFEDSTGPGFTGQHQAHSGQHGLGSGVTGEHASHNHGTGLTGNHNNNSGLTGDHSSHSHGAGLGHNHGLSNETTARSDLGQTGAHTHDINNNNNSKPGMAEKIKEAVSGHPAGTNTGSHTADSTHDRVGDLSQRAANYESTGASGPATGGAAGTDRFDTGKHHHTGAGAGTGAGLTGGNTEHGLREGEGRAEKGTGGLGGLLTTTDKDFLGNRDRMATGGAYQDTDKHFQNNTSGPGGNSALTGREGNPAHNPVAQAQSRGENVGPTAGHQSGLSSGTEGTGVSPSGLDEHGQPQKKGIMEKIMQKIT